MSESESTDVQATGDVQLVSQDGVTVRFGTATDKIAAENHERAKDNVDERRVGLTAFPVRSKGYVR